MRSRRDNSALIYHAPETTGKARKILSTGYQSQDWGNESFCKRTYQFCKCGTHQETDRYIHQVTLGGKCFKVGEKSHNKRF